MVVLAEPDPSDMVHAISKAIHLLPQIDPQTMHDRVSSLTHEGNYLFIIYDEIGFWYDVAKITLYHGRG